jgi:hypothetical protein
MTALSGSRGTGQAGQPIWWASWAVRSASLPLPSEQLHHATGVLSSVWILRVALNEPARLMPKEATVAKPWRCRIRLHRWQRIRNPKGGRYRECRDCGKQQDSSGSPPSMAGPMS